MNQRSPKSKKPAESLLDRLTGTTGKVTALLVAVAALLSAVPPVRNAAQSAYCAFIACSGAPNNGPAPPPNTPSPPAPPSSKVLAVPDITTIDGSRNKSGTMSNIRVSLVDNNGRMPDTFVAEWTWSGSGGTQQGSQTVNIDLKSAAGATLQTLAFPLDRSHCYYPGHDQSFPGNLNVSAKLITSISVSVTSVEGTQHPC